MAIFKFLGKIANEKTLRMVYFSFGQSILTYCITTWGAARKSYMMRVERAQRALFKTACGLQTPTDALYSKLGV